MIALPSLPRPRWRTLATVAAGLVASLGALHALQPAVDGAPVEVVKPGPFVVSIKGVGDLVPAERHMVAPPFSAKVDSIVDEGTEVKAGTVVARLNTQDIEERLQEEQLNQATLVKDEQVRQLTAARDRKKLVTDLQTARDNLAMQRLLLRQDEAGLPKPTQEGLVLKAAEAKRAYETAQESYHLQEGLLAKGIIRPIDLDNAKVAYLQARRDHEVADTALAVARRGYPGQQVQMGRLAVRRAEIDLALVQGKLASLARTTVMDGQVAAAERAHSAARVQIQQHRMELAALKAPTNGVVVLNAVWTGGARKKLQVGDEAREGQPFMEIADVSRVYIRTEIPEVDIGRVHVGMPARVHVATLDRSFDGKLEKLGVLAYEKPNVVNREGAPKVFEGMIALGERSHAFRPGMTVDVDLIVDTFASAITVPNTALWTHAGETYVWLSPPGGGEPVRRVVKAGEHTEERTVITQGLAPGERIRLESP